MQDEDQPLARKKLEVIYQEVVKDIDNVLKTSQAVQMALQQQQESLEKHGDFIGKASRHACELIQKTVEDQCAKHLQLLDARLQEIVASAGSMPRLVVRFQWAALFLGGMCGALTGVAGGILAARLLF